MEGCNTAGPPATGPPAPVMPQAASTVIMTQPQTAYAYPGAAPQVAPTGQGYPQGLRGWSTGLFGCFDDVTTCKCKEVKSTSPI